MLTRRQILVSAGATLASVAAAGGGYGFLVEPDWFEVTQHEIPTKWLRGSSRIRILHLSDLHASPAVPLDRIESAIHLGLEMKPDLICLTGDYITDTDHPDLNTYKKLLAKLPAAAPTYASTGNHDGGRWGEAKNRYPSSELIRGMLSEAGIVVPHNAYADAEIAGERVQIVGIGDHWAREQNARQAFKELPRNADRLRITLSHNPDTKEILQYFSWELMLSGHTHGGQVVVPGFGPLILPVNDRRYYKGLHTWQGRRLYITRGVGGVAGAVRFACRPEVTILDLVPGESPVELTESRPRRA
jgi:predicted MPP superfamily phosphohydrolase